jgi:multidrug efflux pump subunit AcrB
LIGFAVVSMVLLPFLGQDFFPSIDAGQFDMNVRMRSGMRIEETARSIDQIEQMIRQIIPADQARTSSIIWGSPTAASMCRTTRPERRAQRTETF